MGAKLGVPSGDDLIDVYTRNIFNNLIPASKKITPKKHIAFHLFITDLSLQHLFFALNCSVIVKIHLVPDPEYFKG
jgi:hypothetical protein